MNNMKFGKTTVFAAVFAPLAAFAAELTLFDSAKDSAVVESGAVVAKTPEGLVVSYSEKPEPLGGVAIDGNWDLSKYSALKFEIENLGKGDIPLIIVAQNAKPDWGKRTGFQQIYLPLSSGKTLEMPLASLFRGEVYDTVKDFRKMRGNPFSMFTNNVDVSKIERVRVYVRYPKSSDKWRLKKITAEDSSTYKAPAWFGMPKEKFFPFIDKYGQFIHKEWKDKIHSDADFAAERKKEAEYFEKHAGAPDRDKWGGWKDGPQLAATGRFRIEKVGGKWWLVDPDGKLFWSHGAVRVSPSSGITPLDGRKFYFKDLPAKDDAFAQFYYTHDELLRPYYEKRGIKETYDFSAANLRRKYGADWLEKFADICHKRFKSWGLNTIANRSDKRVYMQNRTPFIERFEIKSPELSGSEGWWWSFRDPFNPKFRENIRKNLADRKDELSDPWCIGLFVDNELDWGHPDSHAVWTLLSPADCVAKSVFAADLRKKYGTVENLNAVWGSKFPSWEDFLKVCAKPPKGAYDDCVAFSEKVIEEYYKVIRDEVKAAEPQLLYMGCRFGGVPKYNPQAMYIGAKYCDVISYNIYRDTLDELSLPAGIDKPIMIGEFHFGALDRGKFHTGLVAKNTQEERAQAYFNYVESALKHPQVIGTHWHQFADQATTGRFDGENFQVGFTDICDTPYWETVDKVREIGYKMYKVRSGKEK